MDWTHRREVDCQSVIQVGSAGDTIAPTADGDSQALFARKLTAYSLDPADEGLPLFRLSGGSRSTTSYGSV